MPINYMWATSRQLIRKSKKVKCANIFEDTLHYAYDDDDDDVSAGAAAESRQSNNLFVMSNRILFSI